MNAIREPPEPMGEDLECSETIYSIVVINQFNSECYILIQNEIYLKIAERISSIRYFTSS